MLTPEQQMAYLTAPCLALNFLVRPEQRDKKLNGMEEFSDSACFNRLYHLFWTFHDAEPAALLNSEERAALIEFNRVFRSLPWQVIEAHPHISELPNNDLSPLIPAGEKLLRLLETRTARMQRFGWLNRLTGIFSQNARVNGLRRQI